MNTALKTAARKYAEKTLLYPSRFGFDTGHNTLFTFLVLASFSIVTLSALRGAHGEALLLNAVLPITVVFLYLTGAYLFRTIFGWRYKHFDAFMKVYEVHRADTTSLQRRLQDELAAKRKGHASFATFLKFPVVLGFYGLWAAVFIVGSAVFVAGLFLGVTAVLVVALVNRGQLELLMNQATLLDIAGSVQLAKLQNQGDNSL